MNEDWPTQEEDLQVAAEIMDEHMFMHGDEPISLLHLIFKGDDEDFDVQVSDLMSGVTEHFICHYGEKKGKDIARKVLTKLLLVNKTIH
jgi:hypothetical protein